MNSIRYIGEKVHTYTNLILIFATNAGQGTAAFTSLRVLLRPLLRTELADRLRGKERGPAEHDLWRYFPAEPRLAPVDEDHRSRQAAEQGLRARDRNRRQQAIHLRR